MSEAPGWERNKPCLQPPEVLWSVMGQQARGLAMAPLTHRLIRCPQPGRPPGQPGPTPCGDQGFGLEIETSNLPRRQCGGTFSGEGVGGGGWTIHHAPGETSRPPVQRRSPGPARRNKPAISGPFAWAFICSGEIVPNDRPAASTFF